jgi:hypothetical protein
MPDASRFLRMASAKEVPGVVVLNFAIVSDFAGTICDAGGAAGAVCFPRPRLDILMFVIK